MHDTPPDYLKPDEVVVVDRDTAMQTGRSLIEAYDTNTAVALTCAAQAGALWAWAVQAPSPDPAPASDAPAKP